MSIFEGLAVIVSALATLISVVTWLVSDSRTKEALRIAKESVGQSTRSADAAEAAVVEARRSGNLAERQLQLIEESRSKTNIHVERVGRQETDHWKVSLHNSGESDATAVIVDCVRTGTINQGNASWSGIVAGSSSPSQIPRGKTIVVEVLLTPELPEAANDHPRARWVECLRVRWTNADGTTGQAEWAEVPKHS